MDARSAIRRRTGAAVLVLALVAGACSSGGGGGDETSRSAGGNPARRAGSSECTFSDPGHGGKLVYGIEADTGSAWTPSQATLAISGHMIAKTVYDTLTLLGEDGEALPNLAARFEANADATAWTFTLRKGVTFHDGTPLDGAAAADNLNRMRTATLTGNALRHVTDVTSDGMTFTVTLSEPQPGFPKVLSTQIGYVASPKWLAAVDDDPKAAARPVGTGPFRFKAYVPGNGNSYIGTCNPDYWRKGMPRLDEVEFRVYEDIQSRANALLSGQVDVIHTANGNEIAQFRKRTGEFDLHELTELRETSYVLFNNAAQVDLGGGPQDNPLGDVEVRRALAMASDAATLIEARSAGVDLPANGPFPPGYVGHLEDTGFPTFDLPAAKKAVAEWEAEHGDLVVNYATTIDPFNRVTAELIKEQWEQAGITVKIDTIEQGQFILMALTGKFQAFGWRNHGRPDPVMEDLWWHSDTAVPAPGIALNFGRIADEVIDRNLDVLRTSSDPRERRRAAEAVNRRFGEQVYNLWGSWNQWAVVARPGISDLVSGFSAPGGGAALQQGQGFVGSHFVSQTSIAP